MHLSPRCLSPWCHLPLFFFSEPQQCRTGEEATSVQRAAGRFITLRRCSVTARVSTNAVFSAVSTAGKPTLLELIQRTTSVFFPPRKVEVKYFMSLLVVFSTLYWFNTLTQPLFYVVCTSFIHFRHTLGCRSSVLWNTHQQHRHMFYLEPVWPAADIEFKEIAQWEGQVPVFWSFPLTWNTRWNLS